jgi:2-haloalkanoic acid dehalogenase type II
MFRRQHRDAAATTPTAQFRMNLQRIRALTLDLDDTLWPVWPAIERAELALHAWLRTNAPATALQFDVGALRALRDAVGRQRPEWTHDLTALRRESLRLALLHSGDDVVLAEAAFEVFFAARNAVDLYPEVPDALRRLSAAYPLLALTNGNADLARVGVAPWFRGGLSAREFGVGKPDPRIFIEACRRLGCEPAEVLHVGDDLVLDVEGARAAGMQTAWVRRGVDGVALEPGCFADLAALVELLGC